MNTKSTLLAIGIGASLAACTVPTRIESSWTDMTFSGEPFERVAVVALFDTAAESRTFEENAARELESRGIEAVEGYTIVGEDGRMGEEDELRGQVADAGVDGILIYRLIAVDERETYRPPPPELSWPPLVVRGDPYYWYYYPGPSYYWHWRSSLDVTRSAGYWDEHRYVIVESSFYDARKDQLVWTGKSETMDDREFAELAGSIAERITDELIARDVVAPVERTAARL